MTFDQIYYLQSFPFNQFHSHCLVSCSLISFMAFGLKAWFNIFDLVCIAFGAFDCLCPVSSVSLHLSRFMPFWLVSFQQVRGAEGRSLGPILRRAAAWDPARIPGTCAVASREGSRCTAAPRSFGAAKSISAPPKPCSSPRPFSPEFKPGRQPAICIHLTRVSVE
jgi:hypothetical protein